MRCRKRIKVILNMNTTPGHRTPIKTCGNKERTIDPEGAAALIERTTPKVKDKSRKLSEPIVIGIKVNGHAIRALVDTGSMADFISTTVVDQ